LSRKKADSRSAALGSTAKARPLSARKVRAPARGEEVINEEAQKIGTLV